MDSFFVFGLKPVLETLTTRPEKVEKIYLAQGRTFDGYDTMQRVAHTHKISITTVPSSKLSTMIGEGNHQGVVILMRSFEYVDLDEFLDGLDINTNPCLVLLDELEDTHNVGAIIRSAVAAGASGVIIPKHRSAPINGTVYKTSAGLVDKIPIIKVVNTNVAIEKLKKAKVWVVGLDGKRGTNMWQQDFKMPMCIVVGNEEVGVREKTLEACDFVASIAMTSQAESLNASVATALVLYEWKRQNS